MGCVEIWSLEFKIPGKGAGYLEKTWDLNECPIDYINVREGDIVSYRFPKSGTIYIVKIIKKTFDSILRIQVEVLDIIR